jgi:3-phenylpropionate/cinnamic acid dioxygenase small subunit
VRALETAHGKEQAQDLVAAGETHMLMFPNMAILQSQLRVIYPRAVDQTDVHYYVVRWKGIPDAMTERLLRQHEELFGPADFGSPDDVEMFERSQVGLNARVDPWLLLIRGQGSEKRDDLGVLVGRYDDEVTQRAFWRRYRQVMTACGRTQPGVLGMTVNRRALEEFLYREARLMDEHCYDEWLSLWAPGSLYLAPCSQEDLDPHTVNIIINGPERRQDRVTRLRSGNAYAQKPPSRLVRLISNVDVLEEKADGEVVVRSNFLLVELPRGCQRLLAGRQRHRLRPRDSSFEIVWRKVVLLNNDEPVSNLTFLI